MVHSAPIFISLPCGCISCSLYFKSQSCFWLHLAHS